MNKKNIVSKVIDYEIVHWNTPNLFIAHKANRITYIKEQISKQIKYLTIVVLISVLFILLLPKTNNYMKYAFMDKLFEMFNPSTKYISAKVRQDSIIYPLQMFLKFPLFGVGASGLGDLEEITGHNMNTFTPINWYARWGVFFGTMMMYGLWKFTKFMTFDNVRRIFIFGIINVFPESNTI